MSLDRLNDGDAAYHWLLAMCRRWLIERAAQDVEPDPFVPLRPEGWAAVEKLGHFHSLEPMLFSLFGRVPTPDSNVPDRVRARWEKAYYSNRIRNTEALNLLSRVLERCREAQADVLVLKGPAAMAEVYRDVGLRPMADLDILCRPSDLLVVTGIARSLGFGAGALYVYHVALRYGEQEGGLLELHFDMHDLVRNKARFMESAWRDQMTASIEEWVLPVMSLEHQVVFDVAHCAHHDFDIGLKHVVDFAGRLMPHGIDLQWDRLSMLLHETGLTDQFLLLVGMVEKLLRLPLAASIGSVPVPAQVESFERDFLERSKGFGLVARRVAGSGLLRQQSLAAKAAYAWKRLFPPLVAVQAANNSRSRGHALVYRPIQVVKTLADVASRLYKEAHRPRGGGAVL